MPAYWCIDSRARLVTLTVEGRTTLDELTKYVAAVAGAGAIAYAKIYDGTASEGGLDSADMLALGARFREFHTETLGPLAIVGPESMRERLLPALGALAAGKRALRFFTTIDQAMEWIDTIRHLP